MNVVALENVIGARIVQSLAVAGVDVQGVFSEVAPEGYEIKQGADPLVMFYLTDGDDDDTFFENGGRCVYQVWVTDHVMNGVTNAQAAYAAIYGNGTPSNAGTAGHTMGLHRWKGSPTGLNMTQCRRIRFGHPHEGEALRYFTNFEVYASDA